MSDHARFYQDHKDDEAEWGDPVQGSELRQRLGSVVSVRLSPEQEDILRAHAQELGLGLSSFIREAALRDCQPVVRAQFGSLSETRSSTADLLDTMLLSAEEEQTPQLLLNLSVSSDPGVMTA